MLLYGGIGLLVAGILFMIMPNKIVSDPEKAANAKKQAPILAAVGAVMLFIRFMIVG